RSVGLSRKEPFSSTCHLELFFSFVRTTKQLAKSRQDTVRSASALTDTLQEDDFHWLHPRHTAGGVRVLICVPRQQRAIVSGRQGQDDALRGRETMAHLKYN